MKHNITIRRCIERERELETEIGKPTFFFSSPEVAGRESGREKKRESVREKKRESGRENKIEAGRETVTNITYITIQMSSKYHKIDVVMYVYRGVNSKEKSASPDTNYVM